MSHSPEVPTLRLLQRSCAVELRRRTTMLLDQELMEWCLLNHGNGNEGHNAKGSSSPPSASSSLFCSDAVEGSQGWRGSAFAVALGCRLSEMCGDKETTGGNGERRVWKGEENVVRAESRLVVAIGQLRMALQPPEHSHLLAENPFTSWRNGIELLLSLATEDHAEGQRGRSQEALTEERASDRPGNRNHTGETHFNTPCLLAALVLAEVMEAVQPYAAEFYPIHSFLSRSAASRRRKQRYRLHLNEETEGSRGGGGTISSMMESSHLPPPRGPFAMESRDVSAKKAANRDIKARITWSVGAVVPLSIIHS